MKLLGYFLVQDLRINRPQVNFVQMLNTKCISKKSGEIIEAGTHSHTMKGKESMLLGVLGLEICLVLFNC